MSEPVMEEPEEQPPLDDGEELAREVRRAGRPKRRGRGWGWVALLAVLALIAIGGIELVARFPELVRRRVIEEASARGLRLEAAQIEPVGLLPWESGPRMIVLREVVATVDGVDGVELRMQRVEVDVEGFAPVRARARGVAVRAERPAALFELERAASEGRLAELPVEVAELRVRVQQLTPALPAGLLAQLDEVRIAEGEVDLGDAPIELEVPVVPGVKLGPYHARLERSEGRLTVRADELPGLTLRADEALAKLELKVERADRARLRSMLPGVELPDVRVDATIVIELEGTAAPKGSVEATVVGWTPPRPKELGGIVYGETTRLRAAFARDGLAAMRLESVEVKVGSLSLRGAGRVDALAGGALTLELDGRVACRELAASAVGAHLGLPAAAIAAQLTKGRLGGDVALHLSVEAPLSRPTEAKIVPSATLRCKLVL